MLESTDQDTEVAFNEKEHPLVHYMVRNYALRAVPSGSKRFSQKGELPQRSIGTVSKDNVSLRGTDGPNPLFAVRCVGVAAAWSINEVGVFTHHRVRCDGGFCEFGSGSSEAKRSSLVATG
jgi:hypothetical protein